MAAVRNGGDVLAITRLLPDGTVDQGFGTSDGYGAIDVGAPKGSARNQAEILAARPGGGWLVAGSAPGGFALGAFTADGRPDAGFGSGGKVVTNVDGKPGTDRLYSLTAVPGGFVAVGTESVAGKHPHLMVARYTTAGKLDRRFSKDGRLSVSLDPTGYFLDNPSAVIARPKGAVLIANTVERYPGPRTLMLVGITRSGKLDSSFGGR